MDDFSNIDSNIQKLELEKGILLNKAMASNNPEKMHAAIQYLHDHRGKSVLVRPDSVGDAKGYREKDAILDFDTLRTMAKLPLIRSIIETRRDQVSSFAAYSTNTMKPGWAIRPKRGIFDDHSQDLTDPQKKDIESIAAFIENTGSVRDKFSMDNFNTFLRKITKDSLELDQMTFEIVWNRKGELAQFIPTDGSTYKYLRPNSKMKEVRGYKPFYVQIIQGRLYQEFYPFELCFAARNSSTNINKFKYGESEIEILIKIITWVLFGDEYNGRFFSQGSSPKGILHIKGNNFGNQKVDEIRSQWNDQVGGINNAWRIPMLGGEKVEWINMQQSNKDMEFSRWNEYLVKVACAVYKIDPMEIGFAQKAPGLQNNNEQAIYGHSQDKGLQPLLKFIENQLNLYIVSEMAEDYEFYFTGLDNDDEKLKLEDRIKKMQYKSIDETREDDGLPPIKEGGDVISNPTWLQKIQADAFGGEESNEAVDDEYGDEDDYGGLDEEQAAGVNRATQEFNEFDG